MVTRGRVDCHLHAHWPVGAASVTDLHDPTGSRDEGRVVQAGAGESGDDGGGGDRTQLGVHTELLGADELEAVVREHLVQLAVLVGGGADLAAVALLPAALVEVAAGDVDAVGPSRVTEARSDGVSHVTCLGVYPGMKRDAA